MFPILGIMASSKLSLPTVSGGTLYSDGTYYYRKFTANGTLGISGGELNYDFFLIAGGAGAWYYGGGSGAGGLRNASGVTGSTNQTIVIGAGGSTGAVPANGSNSTAFGYTSTGGGAGGQLGGHHL